MADPFDIEAVRREWIGKVVGEVAGRYPVEHDPIRRHCHMTGDTNPLVLDPETAATGPFGAVVAPPVMASLFAGRGTWPPREGRSQAPSHRSFTYGVPTPGDRGINMGVRWRFPRPVRVGDRLSERIVVTDVFVKPIKLDPQAVWIVTEHQISNQHDVLVAVRENTVLVHRAPDEIA